MSLAGFYINLDRSTDRDARMRAQLEALSLAGRYSRFPAVDGALLSGLASTLLPCGVGCFMSYFRVLEKNLGSEQHLHVMEDDAIVTAYRENHPKHRQFTYDRKLRDYHDRNISGRQYRAYRPLQKHR